MELSQSEKIELLSEDVQEILGRMPPWITRRGITVIFVIVICLIAGTFVFKYPDVISSSVVILSENPPVSIVARTTGKIDHLWIENEQIVKAGEPLAILENTADYNHIVLLEEKLGQLGDHIFSNDFTGIMPEYKRLPRLLSKQEPDARTQNQGLKTQSTIPYTSILGPVQSSFSNFHRQYNEFRNYLTMDIIGKKILSMRQQLKDYEKYSERLNIQAANQESSVKLNYRQYQRDSSLFSTGVIAPAEFEKSEQTFLQAENSYQNLLASLANTQMQMNQLRYQVIDLENQRLDDTGAMVNSLREAYDNLKATIAEWRKTYVLTTPIDGKVTFTSFWSRNQFVTAGEQVFTVVPSRPQKIIGRLRFPVAGSGKVETGQKVLVRLDNFPYTEFGMLEGTIKNISLIPTAFESGVYYTAEISLDDDLITNYGKTLPFNQEMQGTGEIITKNISLFERLIQPMKSAIYRSTG